MILKVHQISVPLKIATCTWRLHCFDSILSVLAPKGRHTRSTSLPPLATSEVDPEEIIRKGKTSQKGTSIVVPSFSDNFHNPSLQTPVIVFDSPTIQTAGVSRNLIFGSFHARFLPSYSWFGRREF
jgi:hypothetical protein